MGEVSTGVLRDSLAFARLQDRSLHSMLGLDCKHTLPHPGDYGTVYPGVQTCHPTSGGHGRPREQSPYEGPQKQTCFTM